MIWREKGTSWDLTHLSRINKWVRLIGYKIRGSSFIYLQTPSQQILYQPRLASDNSGNYRCVHENDRVLQHNSPSTLSSFTCNCTFWHFYRTLVKIYNHILTHKLSTITAGLLNYWALNCLSWVKPYVAFNVFLCFIIIIFKRINVFKITKQRPVYNFHSLKCFRCCKIGVVMTMMMTIAVMNTMMTTMKALNLF